uniref:C2H2-type domain-containing protein n=1 Tax=viral metagenome TaxID=1070528 RepID=A0A6C0CRI9_9ZZZZ
MKHFETKKDEKGTKTDEIFHCKNCDYITSHIGHWKRHLETKKHKKLEMKQNETNETKKDTKRTKRTGKQKKCNHTCDICNESFGSRTTLWRHKKNCIEKTNSKESVSDMSELQQALEENKALREQMLKDAKEHNEYLRKQLEKKEENLKLALKDGVGQSANTINNNYGINNNNNFNINVFLNEKCSNAMTIQDFAKKLQLTMDDLINAKQNKAKGIANIVVKNLEPLAITDRPVHTINKNEWFVNDEKDGWEGNKPDKVISETRHGIRKKWPDVFQKQHPEWITNEKEQNMYVEIAGMATADLSDKEKKSISKTIGKTCKIKPEEL